MRFASSSIYSSIDFEKVGIFTMLAKIAINASTSSTSRSVNPRSTLLRLHEYIQITLPKTHQYL
jgi:hypothetical protein